MFRSMREGVVRTIALVAVAAGTTLAHASLPHERAAAQGELWIPDPGIARIASLGFENLVSDYHWLQALQIVGSSESNPGQYGAILARLVEVVTTLDPWVDHPYRFAALWLTDSLASVRKADALLDQGIAYHPTDWRNPFYQGVNRFLYLDDAEGAADSMERAMRLPGSPAYLPRLVARLRAGGGSLDAAAMMMAELLEGAEDPYTRASYQKTLDAIETERRARVLDAARTEFQRRHGRDITRVEDLAEGPEAVLRALPPELHGKGWVLDPGSGRIVSAFYGERYEPFLHAAVEREREQLEQKEQEGRS